MLANVGNRFDSAAVLRASRRSCFFCRQCFKLLTAGSFSTSRRTTVSLGIRRKGGIGSCSPLGSAARRQSADKTSSGTFASLTWNDCQETFTGSSGDLVRQEVRGLRDPWRALELTAPPTSSPRRPRMVKGSPSSSATSWALDIRPPPCATLRRRDAAEISERRSPHPAASSLCRGKLGLGATKRRRKIGCPTRPEARLNLESGRILFSSTTLRGLMVSILSRPTHGRSMGMVPST
mmetsp:Transcript_41360/g.109577  ORF Transcript_41360/g.109577 Transcript_41360/m.109577 type:complete len:236 (-) Transcript_41360:33-740(-)